MIFVWSASLSHIIWKDWIIIFQSTDAQKKGNTCRTKPGNLGSLDRWDECPLSKDGALLLLLANCCSLALTAAHGAYQMLLFALIVVKTHSPFPHQDFCFISQTMPTAQIYRNWAAVPTIQLALFQRPQTQTSPFRSYPGTWLASGSRCWVIAFMSGVLFLVCNAN